MDKRLFLRSKLATDWEQPVKGANIIVRVMEKFLSKIVSNPTYHPKMHLIREWLIEFENDQPGREIGIGKDGEPVLAGPTSVDYGFWLDTNMTYSDFEGTPISESEFEEAWKASASARVGKDVL